MPVAFNKSIWPGDCLGVAWDYGAGKGLGQDERFGLTSALADVPLDYGLANLSGIGLILAGPNLTSDLVYLDLPGGRSRFR